MNKQYEAVVNENTVADDCQSRQLMVEVKDGVPKSNVAFMYISAVTVNLLLFSCTSCLGWTSPVLSSLESPNVEINPLGRPVTPLETSLIASLMVLGASFSPLVTAKVGDLFGRKRALVFISLPHIISLLVLAFATNVWIYYVTRFVSGLVLGNVMGLLPVYLSEIAEMHNRSTVGVLISISISGGILYSFVIGPLVSVRVLTLCCAAPAILFLLIFGLFIPESPVYLVAQGDVRGASRVLRKLRRQTGEQVQQELRLIMGTIEKERQESQGKWTELFKDVGLRKSLIICLGLFVFMQFSGVNPLTAFQCRDAHANLEFVPNHRHSGEVHQEDTASRVLARLCCIPRCPVHILVSQVQHDSQRGYLFLVSHRIDHFFLRPDKYRHDDFAMGFDQRDISYGVQIHGCFSGFVYVFFQFISNDARLSVGAANVGVDLLLLVLC